MFKIWSVILLCCLLILGFSDGHAKNISTYKACDTQSIRTGGPGEVAYIMSPDDGKPNDCKLHITACPQCKLELTVLELEMSLCQQPLPLLQEGCSSQCTDFISVQDPAYISSTTSYISNATLLDFMYTTQTRLLDMQFCLSSAARFKLKYVVKEKVQILYNSVPGYFTSPNFPSGYQPSGDYYKYIINNTAAGGYIRLQFTDWHLANKSKITIYHNHENSSYELIRYGSASRPFVKSQGSVLIVVFETGPENGHLIYLGFRAEYTFSDNREWPNKPYNYECGAYFLLTWGGQFSFRTDSCPEGEIIDCVWVLYRYPLPAYSDYIWLSVYDLRLEYGDILEIRSGNNSQGALLKMDKDITSTPADVTELDAIYIHLRAVCKTDRLFKAAFVSYDNAQKQGHKYHCPYSFHFACQNERCIHKKLRCDGINHCGDWSDERSCHNRDNSCTSCQDGQGWFCSDVRCDGRSDCLDGSDEKDCMPGSTSLMPPLIESNHYYWGTITPVVLISLILGIITCIVISYYIRRKRLLRERNRCLTRTQAQTTRNNVLIESLGLSPGIYGIAPPSYEEALIAQYIPRQGTVNTAFEGTLDFPVQPPPYSPKCDVQLPVQYLPPYAETQSPASELTEPGASQCGPCLSGHRGVEARHVTSIEGRLVSSGVVSPGDAADYDLANRVASNISEEGANLDGQQIDNDVASSLTCDSERTEIGTVQAMLAGRGALTGIVDIPTPALDTPEAHSQMVLDGGGSEQEGLDATMSGSSTRLPSADTPLTGISPADDGTISCQGRDNAAFEHCSLHGKTKSFTNDVSSTDGSQNQLSKCKQGTSSRIHLSEGVHSGSNRDAGMRENNYCDDDASINQDDQHPSENMQDLLKSAVIIEDTGDVFV